MANPDMPRRALGVRASQIEVASGIDGEVPERLQLARSGVDRETFRHRAEVKRQRAAQSDSSPIRIEEDMTIVDIIVVYDRSTHDRSGTMFPIESTLLHPVADGGVERAAALLGQHQCESHGF